MLASYKYEYDLAAHKVYQMKKDLPNFDDDDAEEHEWHKTSVNLLNAAWRRRRRLAELKIMMRPYAEDSPEYRKLKKEYDTKRAEVFMLCADISSYWERTIGYGVENSERARLNLKRKYD